MRDTLARAERISGPASSRPAIPGSTTPCRLEALCDLEEVWLSPSSMRGAAVLSDPQLSPAASRRVLIDRGMEGEPPDRQSTAQQRRHQPGAADIRRAGESARAVTPKASDRCHRAPRSATAIRLRADAEGGEARKVTSHATATGNITWAPDGSSIYFTAADAKSAEERERDRVQDDVYAFEENNYKQRHLWSTDLEGKTKRVTDGNWSVGNYELSADGARIAMHRMPSPLLEFSDRSEVWLMSADGSNAKQLTTNVVPEGNAAVSPDGSTVLFTSGSNAQFDLYYNDKLFLVPAAGGPARVLLPDAPYEVENAAWSKDGRSIYFTANMGVHNEVMKVDVAVAAGDEASRKASTTCRDGHSPKSTAGTCSSATPARAPSEVYRMPATGGEPKRSARCSKTTSPSSRTRASSASRGRGDGGGGVTVEGLPIFTRSITKRARSTR